MPEQTWDAVDAYFTSFLAPSNAALEAALAASDEAGLPPINVAPNQGKLLMLLAKAVGARSILEIGTLGGYSTIWLASALPADGRLVTLEAVPKHAEVARANISRAGYGDRVEVRVGRALETLPQLEADAIGPFDMVFIDADKQHNADYVGWALRLTRPGSLIIVDNVVRNGRVIDAASDDASVQGTRRLIDYLADEPRLDATALQTVGSKGYDGFVMAIVTG